MTDIIMHTFKPAALLKMVFYYDIYRFVPKNLQNLELNTIVDYFL